MVNAMKHLWRTAEVRNDTTKHPPLRDKHCYYDNSVPSQNYSLLKEKFTPKMETYHLQTFMFFPTHMSFFCGTQNEWKCYHNSDPYVLCTIKSLAKDLWDKQLNPELLPIHYFLLWVWNSMRVSKSWDFFSNCFFTFLTREKHETWSCQQINKIFKKL